MGCISVENPWEALQTKGILSKVVATICQLLLTGETREVAKAGDPDAARKLLDRALISLPQRKHIKVALGSNTFACYKCVLKRKRLFTNFCIS